MMSSNTIPRPKDQGFKKKNSNVGTSDPINSKPIDKLGDLKSKLQKEKQMMKKTGKRFRQENSISTQQISISTDNDLNQIKINNIQNKHDISIGSQQPLKQTMSLKQIGFDNYTSNSTKKETLMSSQLFQKQIKQQKKRSKEVYDFLKRIQLQNYAQALIQNGFDQLQTLADLTTQDLNHVMMRAHQQIRLLQQIKSINNNKNVAQPPKIAKQQFGSTSTLFRLKTQPMEYPSGSKTARISSSQILTRLRTQHNLKKQQQYGPKPGSFLYSVGSKNWSTQDQIRRACSVCFKVQQQMERKGQCFYCKNCYKYVSQDLLQISLGKTMERQYKK